MLFVNNSLTLEWLKVRQQNVINKRKLIKLREPRRGEMFLILVEHPNVVPSALQVYAMQADEKFAAEFPFYSKSGYP